MSRGGGVTRALQQPSEAQEKATRTRGVEQAEQAGVARPQARNGSGDDGTRSSERTTRSRRAQKAGALPARSRGLPDRPASSPASAGARAAWTQGRYPRRGLDESADEGGAGAPMADRNGGRA